MNDEGLDKGECIDHCVDCKYYGSCDGEYPKQEETVMKDLWIARDACAYQNDEVFLYEEQPFLREDNTYSGFVLCQLTATDFGSADILDHIPIQRGECYKISFEQVRET